MKKICIPVTLSFILAFLIPACKKDPAAGGAQPTSNTPIDYIAVVGKYIRQHPAVINYDSIDFTNYRISKQTKCWYVRLPFKNKSMATDFVLLKTDSAGNTSDGRVVHLEQASWPPPAPPTGGGTAASKIIHPFSYNGSIVIRSLDQKTFIESKITGGYIEAFHPGPLLKEREEERGGGSATYSNAKETIIPGPSDELPEVIVVGYLPAGSSGSGMTLADYMTFQNLFNGGGGSGGGGVFGNGTNGSVTGSQAGGTTAVYTYNGGYGGGPANGAGTGGTGGGQHLPTQNQFQQDPPDVTLAFDESFSRPAIDINAWLKCFTDIPDAGATQSITLYGDLPMDGDPGSGMNLWNGNTGHCFLGLSKTNGGQTVTQVIGFTAQSAGKAIVSADAFVPSKLVDNAGHKYNCSITMPLTAAGMRTVMDRMLLMSDMAYSIVNYDCLDFGLDVFNSVRDANPLVIAKRYDPNDPFSNVANGPKLYNLLSAMVANGSAEAGNILIGGSRWIGQSHGPCN